MGVVKNISGETFGRLTAVSYEGSTKWKFECLCGNVVILRGNNVRQGLTKSCGCLARERGNLKHGWASHLNPTVEYATWSRMKTRCYNPKSDRYYRYGARGIKMCRRWKFSFENFLHDMGRRPFGLTSLDRIDNDGNYEPGNCRWATQRTQGNNTNSNVRITFDSKHLTISQWSELIGIKPGTLGKRIRDGWDAEKALTTPVR